MVPVQKAAVFLLFLGVLVFIHELGHFLVAKLLNVKVLKFSIGFGPKVFSFTRGETEYRLAWIPLGGYVRMAGELPGEELDPVEAKRGFLAQPPWRRALIVVAGPVFNLVFPILAYFAVFVGSHQEISTRVGFVEPGLPAASANLQPGDRIQEVDGKTVRTFEEVRTALADVYDRQIPIVVERAGQRITAQITPSAAVEPNPIEKVTRGMIGISPIVRAPVVGVPPGSAAEQAGLKTFDRIVSLNGEPIRDEVAFRAAISRLQGDLTVEVARVQRIELPGAAAQTPALFKLTVPRQPGEMYAALGAEWGDLYVGTVLPGSPAARAGIQRGDRLLTLNDRPITSFMVFALALNKLESEPFQLSWRSGAEEKKAELSQAKSEEEDALKQRHEVLDLGLRQWRGLPESAEPEMVTVRMGPLEALGASVKVVPEKIALIATVIGKLFTGEVAFKSLGGPVMVYQIATWSAERGIDTFLDSMAMLSINLGLMNLLPIPVLDGFHLLAALWEQVRRRPIPMRAREIANMVGLAVLAVLMVMVLKNDITRALR